MKTNEEKIKVKEGRYLIIIPLLITVICGWLDVWTNYTSGEFTDQSFYEMAKNIIRCAMGYLFPSLLSIVIAMIWQQSTMNNEDAPYGVEAGKIGPAIIWTALYSTVFLTCIINYDFTTAIALLTATLIYIVWFYISYLDKRLKIKSKNDMNEEELLSVYLNKNNKKRGFFYEKKGCRIRDFKKDC